MSCNFFLKEKSITCNYIYLLIACFYNIPLQIFRSIGYRSVAIDNDIPFDDKNGVVSCESNDGHVTGLPGITDYVYPKQRNPANSAPS
jgi:hypothetical protein